MRRLENGDPVGTSLPTTLNSHPSTSSPLLELLSCVPARAPASAPAPAHAHASLPLILFVLVRLLPAPVLARACVPAVSHTHAHAPVLFLFLPTHPSTLPTFAPPTLPSPSPHSPLTLPSLPPLAWRRHTILLILPTLRAPHRRRHQLRPLRRHRQRVISAWLANTLILQCPWHLHNVAVLGAAWPSCPLCTSCPPCPPLPTVAPMSTPLSASVHSAHPARAQDSHAMIACLDVRAALDVSPDLVLWGFAPRCGRPAQQKGALACSLL